jgi:hypothetical protein
VGTGNAFDLRKSFTYIYVCRVHKTSQPRIPQRAMLPRLVYVCVTSQAALGHLLLQMTVKAVGVSKERNVELARVERLAVLSDRVDLVSVALHLVLHLLAPGTLAAEPEEGG